MNAVGRENDEAIDGGVVETYNLVNLGGPFDGHLSCTRPGRLMS